MTTRDRQVKAYRRSKEGSRKIAIRGRAVAKATAWVRDEHPGVWQKFLDEATVDVDFERAEIDRLQAELAEANACLQPPTD